MLELDVDGLLCKGPPNIDETLARLVLGSAVAVGGG
jgi:hypothetical protein